MNDFRELRVFDCRDGHVTVIPIAPTADIPRARACERCDHVALPRPRAGYETVSRPGR